MVIYLSGVTSHRDESVMITAGIGIVARPGNGYWRWVDRYPWYGCDIGMGWSEAEPYLDWLDRLPRGRCLYAVSPDAYPDAVESQRRGLEFAPIIRAMGFPVAVVAQDGAERLDWPWGELDVLFLGGERRTNPRAEWKVGASAEMLCREARRHGKWVHMGRCNSWWRIERARAMGCNSVDGTFLKYRRRRRQGETDAARDERGAAEIRQWIDGLAATPMLPGVAVFETPALSVHKEACNA